MTNRKVAVVTGGAQGIGKAICARFLREGWAVAAGDIDFAAARETAAELRTAGELLPIRVDVAEESDVKELLRRARSRFGRIDALVNNAGIMNGKPLARMTLAEWNRVIGTNLTGAFLCAKHAAPELAKRRGAIINISSTRALMSEAGTEAYSASKGGILALTHALAVSLGPRVRVNCILPGWMD